MQLNRRYTYPTRNSIDLTHTRNSTDLTHTINSTDVTHTINSTDDTHTINSTDVTHSLQGTQQTLHIQATQQTIHIQSTQQTLHIQGTQKNPKHSVLSSDMQKIQDKLWIVFTRRKQKRLRFVCLFVCCFCCCCLWCVSGERGGERRWVGGRGEEWAEVTPFSRSSFCSTSLIKCFCCCLVLFYLFVCFWITVFVVKLAKHYFSQRHLFDKSEQNHGSTNKLLIYLLCLLPVNMYHSRSEPVSHSHTISIFCLIFFFIMDTFQPITLPHYLQQLMDLICLLPVETYPSQSMNKWTFMYGIKIKKSAQNMACS